MPDGTGLPTSTAASRAAHVNNRTGSPAADFPRAGAETLTGFSRTLQEQDYNGQPLDPMTDPTLDILRRKREIERTVARMSTGIDAQEMAEREEATQAYAGENEQHFAAYLQDCV